MSNKLKIEELAKQNRINAQKALATVGQSVYISGHVDKNISTKQEKTGPRDNTLDIILKSEAREKSIQLQKKSNITITNNTIKIKSIDNLPPNWEAIIDVNSKKTYYWNKFTNITTWEKPKDDSIDNITTSKTNKDIINIHPNWNEEFHRATQQKYYIHKITGMKRWKIPSANDDGTLEIFIEKLSSEVTPTANNVIDQISKKRNIDSESNIQSNKKLNILNK